MVSQLGAFTSFQVNVGANGQNIVGDAANEPSITVDPSNPNKMAIGWRQFNSVMSNFRQGGWAYTSNAGSTWTFPGVLQNNVFRSDPVLYSNETGAFYYLSLVANFQDDIWRSLNGGQSWTQLAFATGGDKQWFTIDRTNSRGHGFQYQSWSVNGNNYNGRQFTRSTDGGFTWMDPINIPNHPSMGTLDVDTNGNLFIGGADPVTTKFWCVRSTDAKNPAVTPTFDQVTEVNLDGQLLIGGINIEGLVGQAFLAVDRSGTATNNNVYMLASVFRSGSNGGSDVMFARSTDGGKTFSAPRRINDDPVNQQWHWFGTLAVAPNGRIDVVWLDSRNSANNRDSQLFYSYSPDGGATWSVNLPVSNSFDPWVGFPDQSKMGDYMTMVSDASGGNVAYCATFNGEQDIYYVRVVPPPFVPQPTPTPSPTPTSTPTSTPTPTFTPTATPTSSPTPTATATATITPPAQTVNLATRMRVESGDNVGIGGFIITGSRPKRVLLRALGPLLKQLGLQETLANPVLQLNGGPAGPVTNDNWKDDPIQRAQIESTGLAPTDELESAIDATLNPGSYTAVVSEKNNLAGIGVIEVYDLSPQVPARLANISTRALTASGNNIVFAGFTLGNNPGQDTVAVRGLGPSLTSAGVPKPLQNPTLELRSADGTLLAANNDWQEDQSQAAALTNIHLGLPNQLESGIVKKLPPGAYTALLIGAGNSTGIGLIEIYDLGP
jgi:hypothetical protein